MAGDLRFLCDEMLAGLGRWLRIAGCDTAIADRGRRDRELVEPAHAEHRILLTRDRRLVEIRTAIDRTIVLECDGIDACAHEVVIGIASVVDGGRNAVVGGKLRGTMGVAKKHQ